ncbi:MAG: tetratricopeptide repeat protein [Deltaproteobacteria bacterium]|nr:tetratricopeptide repeat protein [Deltaproteobacteria bacterium]
MSLRSQHPTNHPCTPTLRRALASTVASLALTALTACAPAIDAQLDEAQSLVAEGRPMAALPLLENVVQRRPGDGPANLLLGQVLIQVGRTQTALAPLERALENERWAVPAGLLLASAHLRDARPRPALEAVNRVLEAHPDQPVALRIRATAHLQIGSDEEALADARHILRVAPEDTQAPILAGTALARLGRVEEAEALLVKLEAEAREQGPASRHAAACVALASFIEAGRRDPEHVAAIWRDCLDRHPADPAVLQGASQYFDQHGDSASSLAALERALAQDPSALGVRLALAHRLAARGDVEAGDRLLVEAAERRSETSPLYVRTASSWQAVASFRLRRGNLAGARDALDRAIASASADGADTTSEELDALQFQRAMLLLELGELDEAREARGQIGVPALAMLIEGRLQLAQGDPGAALDALEQAVRSRPGEPRSHYWLGVAAQADGQIDRALKAWGRALTLDPTATDAALMAARLAHGLGDHNGTVELLRRHRSSRATFPRETALLEARSIAALGQESAAAGLLESVLRSQADPEALVLLAEVLRRSQGPAAAVARIDQAQRAGFDLADPDALPVLRAYAVNAVAAGHAEAGFAAVSRARREHPDSIPLYVIQASVQAADQDEEGAEATLRAAAAENSPGDLESAYLAAKILAARGDTEEAERWLRKVVTANPLHIGACNDLAWLLAGAGHDFDLAVQLAERAVRLRPEGATLDTLGWVRLARGESEEAIEAFSQAVAHASDNPGFRFRLGLALARAGREPEAREAFRAALAAGPFPEAEQARTELARLEP